MVRRVWLKPAARWARAARPPTIERFMKRLSLALMLMVAPAAAAQDAPADAATAAPTPADAPTAAAAPTVTAGLRAEYIEGHAIVVPVELGNAGAAPIQVPDLSNRPWLVEFGIEDASGRRQRRHTKAPAEDAGRQLTLAPRARRSTLVEVPSSGAFSKGSYTLTVAVDLGGDKVVLDAHALKVVAPDPAFGQPGIHVRGMSETLWVHRAAEGADIYLHQLDRKKLTRQRGLWHLGHVPSVVQPRIARAPASAATSRVVVWQTDAKSLALASIQGTAFAGEPRQLTSPWPKVELIGEPLIDGAGRVAVPLWVPSPKGAAGQLRLLSFDARKQPVYRKVASYPARPRVGSRVDAAGNAHLLVAHGDKVDLYTARADVPPKLDLPLPGARLYAEAEGATLADVRFVQMPRDGDRRGGLMVQITRVKDNQAVARIVSLQGGALGDLAPLPLTPGQEVVGIVEGDWRTPAVLAARGSAVELVQPGAAGAVPGVSPGTSGWSVERDTSGAPHLIRVVPGGPVQVTALQVAPRP